MSKPTITFGNRVNFVLWIVCAFLLKFFPRRLAIMTAWLVSRGLYRVLRVRRKVVLENLRYAFPDYSDARLDQIAAQAYENSILTLFEFLQPHLLREKGNLLVSGQHGHEHYERVAHRTCIAVTAHMGNWEMLGEFARMQQVRIIAFAKPLHNRLVNDWVVREREARGVKIVPTTSMLKYAVDEARSGSWLAVVGDQDARKAGIFVQFMNRPASTFSGIAVLSHRLDLPLLPVFSIRNFDRDRTLTGIALEPIFPDTAAPREDEVRRLTQLHVAALESVVRQHPESYFWLHKRWKTQPKDAPKPHPEKSL